MVSGSEMVHAYYSPKFPEFEKIRDGLWFKRVAEGEDHEYRGGYALRNPGDKSQRIILMDEFFLVVRGELTISVSDPPWYKETKTYILKPGDVLFQGRGSKLSYEASAKNEKTLVFYVAIPSSIKGMNPRVFPPSADTLGSVTQPL